MRNPQRNERLIAWMKEHGLTYEEVGGLTGRTASGVHRIATGQRCLKPLQKVEFARRLGVPLTELFDPEGYVSE